MKEKETQDENRLNGSNVEELEKQILEERNLRKEAEMQLKVVQNVLNNFK